MSFGFGSVVSVLLLLQPQDLELHISRPFFFLALVVVVASPANIWIGITTSDTSDYHLSAPTQAWYNAPPRNDSRMIERRPYFARPDKEDGLPRSGALPYCLVNNGRLPAPWKPDEDFIWWVLGYRP